jgi:hypothetical protein
MKAYITHSVKAPLKEHWLQFWKTVIVFLQMGMEVQESDT